MAFGAILGAVCAAVMMAGGSDVSKATVDDLKWMSGSWECAIWGGTFEENWSKPRAGTMVGSGRHMEGTKTAFMEFMSIEPSNGVLTMWMLLGSPSSGDKKGIPFKLVSYEAGVATFENKANDFPSQIIYSKTKDGMKCRIQGTQNGKAAHEDFNFKRA
jgi:hypothetical protein